MSCNAEIISLAKQRVRPTQIAKKFGKSQDQVYSILRLARKRGEDIPLFCRTKTQVETDAEILAVTPRQIVVPMRLFSLLEAEARRRNLTTTEAAQRLLENGLLGTVTP